MKHVFFIPKINHNGLNAHQDYTFISGKRSCSITLYNVTMDYIIRGIAKRKTLPWQFSFSIKLNL